MCCANVTASRGGLAALMWTFCGLRRGTGRTLPMLFVKVESIELLCAVCVARRPGASELLLSSESEDK